jgi:hypothetical protein
MINDIFIVAHYYILKQYNLFLEGKILKNNNVSDMVKPIRKALIKK